MLCKCTRLTMRSFARANDAKSISSRDVQCNTIESTKGHSCPLLLRISSAHAIHYARIMYCRISYGGGLGMSPCIMGY